LGAVFGAVLGAVLGVLTRVGRTVLPPARPVTELGRGSMVGALTMLKEFLEGATVGKEEGAPGLLPQ